MTTSRLLPIGLALLLLALGCKPEVLPKPKAMLRLDYPGADYVRTDSSCAYSFDRNLLSTAIQGGDCSMVLEYPQMKGAIYLTYKTVEGNLDTLIRDAQKLSYEHVVKADNILSQPFVNPDEDVYGMFYEVSGNAASPSQFYVTDSTGHFLTGSLYFHSRPNYDSILPAAVYLRGDIRRLMESLRWNP